LEGVSIKVDVDPSLQQQSKRKTVIIEAESTINDNGKKTIEILISNFNGRYVVLLSVSLNCTKFVVLVQYKRFTQLWFLFCCCYSLKIDLLLMEILQNILEALEIDILV
jgi:hypothetical protein